MFSHFSILSLYMPHGKYDSFSTLYCLCTCFFVSVMFSFPNRDVPINCFAELKKSLLPASGVDTVLENKIMFQGHS